jgi:hypothetical protein
MRNSKRVISKSKTYGFNPWVDQIDAINQIMAEAGVKAESVVLRKLIDEALTARREKTIQRELFEPATEGRTELSIRMLLLKLVQQTGMSLRIQDVSLALLQDVLAESRATRWLSWENLVMPGLREQGSLDTTIQDEFDRQTCKAKDYAYGLAQEIKTSQEISNY